MEKFYLTTAIAYASRKPHFGNTYEIIMADAFARFQRQMGKDVFLCTGTDEHGQKIEDYAKAAGTTPKEYVDRVAGEIKGIWNLMGSSHDYFIRTTDDYHERAVAKIFKKFYDKGDIYKGYYEGWYCTPCESFFTDTQAEGGKCPDCGREVVKAKEEAYFFRMSKYADRLMKHIEDNPGFIEPESRKKEMVNNFLKAGLQDLCVSRTSFTWGIQVDFDPKHVVYVWLDALTNYITAIGYDPDKSFEEQSESFKKYWPADVHIIGKDILRFHTIYWPIFLMALDLPLHTMVFGLPWFNSGNDKMSKSKGNVIYADELAEYFSVDGVRYYALAEMPYNSDGTITYENVLTRYNNDLANNLGNLVSRTHAMCTKYFGGIVPECTALRAIDAELLNAILDGVKDAKEQMASYHVSDSLDSIFTALRRAKKYIDETTPWILAKDEAEKPRLATVIYNLLETVRIAAVALTPYMPSTAEKIFSILGTDKKDYSTATTFGHLESGKSLGVSEVLFARVDEKKLFEEIEAKRAAAEAAEKAVAEPEDREEEIAFEDIGKVELRVAEIIACEPIPKAKKLLKLQVDLGFEKRQVVSGIAKFYTPDELIGKKVILVCNLKPAKLCGVDSYGMLLASGEDEVKVAFLDPEAKNGDRVH